MPVVQRLTGCFLRRLKSAMGALPVAWVAWVAWMMRVAVVSGASVVSLSLHASPMLATSSFAPDPVAMIPSGQCARIVARVPAIEEVVAAASALPDPSKIVSVYTLSDGTQLLSVGLIKRGDAIPATDFMTPGNETGCLVDSPEIVSVRSFWPEPAMWIDSSSSEQLPDAQLAQACSDLWMARNRLMLDRGQCPQTRLARRTFSQLACSSGQVRDLTGQEQIRLRNIKAHETYLGCRVDETYGRLFEAVRGSLALPGQSAVVATTPAGYVNVRSGPSTQGFDVVDRLAPQTLVQVRSRVLNPAGTHRWIEIEYPQSGHAQGRWKSGYVYYTSLEVRERAVDVVGQFEDFPAISCAREPADSVIHDDMIDQITLAPARDAIRSMRDLDPNFAGSAQVITWGCGTGCAAGGILDHATGVWLELPFVIARDMGQDDPLYDYRPDSTLLIARGWMNEELEGPFQFHWTGYGLQVLSDPRTPDSGDPVDVFEEFLIQGDQFASRAQTERASRAYREAAARATSRAERATVLAALADLSATASEADGAVWARAYAKALLSVDPGNPWLLDHRGLVREPDVCVLQPAQTGAADMPGQRLPD